MTAFTLNFGKLPTMTSLFLTIFMVLFFYTSMKRGDFPEPFAKFGIVVSIVGGIIGYVNFGY